jgi:hypothetical protein
VATYRALLSERAHCGLDPCPPTSLSRLLFLTIASHDRFVKYLGNRSHCLDGSICRAGLVTLLPTRWTNPNPCRSAFHCGKAGPVLLFTTAHVISLRSLISHYPHSLSCSFFLVIFSSSPLPASCPTLASSLCQLHLESEQP